MSLNIDKNKENELDLDKELFFNDDFEVIYEGELPNLPGDLGADDYKDVLSSLSSLDPTSSMDVDYLKENLTRKYSFGDLDASPESASDSQSGQKQKKRLKVPNFLSPVSKTAKAGGKAAGKLTNLLLRAATLILIAAVTLLLALTFWKNYGTYGNLTTAVSGHNYILAAYFGVAIFLLFIECIAFLSVLFASKTKSSRSGRRIDTGRGLFSFLFIYLCSWLSVQYSGLIPASPAPLQGLKGALAVYGSLEHTLLFLCSAGVISCLVRRFLIK